METAFLTSHHPTTEGELPWSNSFQVEPKIWAPPPKIHLTGSRPPGHELCGTDWSSSSANRTDMKEVRKRAGSTMNKVSQYQVLPYRGTKLHRLRTPISPPQIKWNMTPRTGRLHTRPLEIQKVGGLMSNRFCSNYSSPDHPPPKATTRMFSSTDGWVNKITTNLIKI